MDCSTPGLPVHHQLPEFPQTHAHWVVMPSNHLILCRPLIFLPSIFPSIRVFSNESALRTRGPKYWSFSFNTSLPYTPHPLGSTAPVSPRSLSLSSSHDHFSSLPLASTPQLSVISLKCKSDPVTLPKALQWWQPSAQDQTNSTAQHRPGSSPALWGPFPSLPAQVPLPLPQAEPHTGLSSLAPTLSPTLCSPAGMPASRAPHILT